jgi:hypothetical protein
MGMTLGHDVGKKIYKQPSGPKTKLLTFQILKLHKFQIKMAH